MVIVCANAIKEKNNEYLLGRRRIKKITTISQRGEMMNPNKGLFKTPYVDISRYEFETNIVKEIPEELARAYHVVAMESTQYYMTVAIASLDKLYVVDILEKKLNKRVLLIHAQAEHITEVINQYYKKEV